MRKTARQSHFHRSQIGRAQRFIRLHLTEPVSLERLAHENPHVRFVDNPDRITPCAMNAGIAAARGQYVAIAVRCDHAGEDEDLGGVQQFLDFRLPEGANLV